MKKIIYIIAAMILTAACSDKGEDQQGGGASEPTLKELICGEWHSTSLAISDSDIYLSLTKDCSFALYQKIGEGGYRLFNGIWNIEGTLLTGRYNDGEDWGSSYNVVLKDETLTLTSDNDAAEVSTFIRCTIPEDVKDTPYVEVKGGAIL